MNSSRAEFGDELDQRLLGRHVVVERRDVDADAIGDIAGAEALEALLDDERPGGHRDGVAAIFGRLAGFGQG